MSRNMAAICIEIPLNERNMLNNILLPAPRFPVKLNVMFGCTATIPKDKKNQIYVKPPCVPINIPVIFRSPIVEHYTELLLLVFSSHHTFLLSVQSEQSEWKIWNFRHGEGHLSDFAVNSR